MELGVPHIAVIRMLQYKLKYVKYKETDMDIVFGLKYSRTSLAVDYTNEEEED